MNTVIKLSPPHISLPVIYCVRRPKKERTVQAPPPVKNRAAIPPNQPRICIYGFDLPPTSTDPNEKDKP